ncbi:TPA: hypothetical protein EYP13_04705 [Candidatus Micrarchaeota archaeon]|nr:hypothetical protein [Candidatus Micrarchaeota archaeon]
MSTRRYRFLMGLAASMMLAAVILPFLMVARVIPSSVRLSFLSYGLSVGGMGLGLYAVLHHFVLPRRRD